MKSLLLLPALAILVSAIPASASETDANAGHWLLRARAVSIVPDEDATIDPVGGTVSISTATVPEFDISYFFTDNVAVELIAATAKHDVTAKNTAVGGVDAGSVWLLPPTVTVQYHYTNLDFARPYVGAGINYTHFYAEDGGALGGAKYDDSVGPALQAGVDIPLGNNLYANLDVKKIWINTDATFTGSSTVKADVDIDPWIFGVGIGYRF
jgi:outer membrane protein